MSILRLCDISDPRLEVFVGLTNHQLRRRLEPERGIVVVESQIAIRVALAEGLVPEAFLLDERRVESMADVLDLVDDDVPVFVLPPEQAERLTGYRVTRGALCAMRRPAQPSLEGLLRASRRLVVLEGITDTSNVGAVFRNAAALGADGVLCAPTCADPLSRRAVRVSMGNVFKVPWLRVESDWPHGVLGMAQELGFACLALALDKRAVPLDDPALARPDRLALVFGSEGQGLSKATLGCCDRTVIIPMAREVDSLNVAASTAVAMWQLFGRGAAPAGERSRRA